MTPRKKNLLFWAIIILIGTSFLPFSKPQKTQSEFINSEEIERKLELFREVCRQNDLKIDSIKKELNKSYNYKLNIIGNVETRCDYSLYSFVTYYGMTDGYNAFIFSLHHDEVQEIKLMWCGGHQFMGLGNMYCYDIVIKEEKELKMFTDALQCYSTRNRCNSFDLEYRLR